MSAPPRERSVVRAPGAGTPLFCLRPPEVTRGWFEALRSRSQEHEGDHGAGEVEGSAVDRYRGWWDSEATRT